MNHQSNNLEGERERGVTGSTSDETPGCVSCDGLQDDDSVSRGLLETENCLLITNVGTYSFDDLDDDEEHTGSNMEICFDERSSIEPITPIHQATSTSDQILKLTDHNRVVSCDASDVDGDLKDVFKPMQEIHIVVSKGTESLEIVAGRHIEKNNR